MFISSENHMAQANFRTKFSPRKPVKPTGPSRERGKGTVVGSKLSEHRDPVFHHSASPSACDTVDTCHRYLRVASDSGAADADMGVVHRH